MKLKRILAALVALAIVASFVPMSFAATPGINIDFTTTDFDGHESSGSRTAKEAADGIYGKDGVMSIVFCDEQDRALAKATSGRTYKDNVALSKLGSRISFQIASSDTDVSEKGVLFYDDNSRNSMDSTILLKLERDGKMYVLGEELCAYEAERWYQIDIEFDKNGNYTAYVDGGYTAKKTGTSSADMTKIFGSASDNVENRTLIYYMNNKDKGTGASALYVDNFETEITDETSAAAVPDSRKIDVTYKGAPFNSETEIDLTGVTMVEEIIADFDVTKGDVKVVNYAGAEVESGAVVPGMKLVISSEDETTKLEYIIDCLNLVLSLEEADEPTRETERDVFVTFDYAGEASVEFWVNGELKETVTEAPYQYTVQHTAGGDYTVKAVVITEGDVETEIEKTYTFEENIAPEITTTANIGASVNQGSPVEISVTATDADFAKGSGVTKIELYIDGNRVGEPVTSEAVETLSHVYTMTNLSLGMHSYYAVATDAEGKVGTSATESFAVISVAEDVIDNATFEEDATGIWERAEDPANYREADDPIRPNNKVLAHEDHAIQSELRIWGTDKLSLFANGVLYWEMEFMTNNVDNRSTMVLRESDGDKEDGTNGSRDEVHLGGANTVYAFEADKWYKVRYVANIKTKKATLYLYNEEEAKWDPISQDRDLTALADIGGLRIQINNDKVEGYRFYVDNIKVSMVTESFYVEDTKYYDDAGTEIYLNNGIVDADIDKIEFIYNSDIGDFFFSKENFKITNSKGEFKRFTVTPTGPSVVIDFDVPLLSQETYTITPVGLDQALTGGTLESSTFTTAAADFDVTSVETTITDDKQLSQVEIGDTVTATVQVKNDTISAQETTVIYAIYSGDKLIGLGYDPDPVRISAGGGSVTVSAAITDEVDDEVTAKIFFWTDLGPTRTVQMDVIE